MIDVIIQYLNQKITSTGYFVEVLGLANRIEREGKIYPAIYIGNEFSRIDFDKFSSVSYWRMNGEVGFSEKESVAKIGKDYTTTIPLKFVAFRRKDAANNDAYFASKLIQGIIATTKGNSLALSTAINAETATISVRSYNDDPIKVANDEYENIKFEPRYEYAMFSIDYEVTIVSNENCFTDICDALEFVKCGKVRIVDETGALIDEVDCGDTYVCSSAGGTVDVHNSDNSFQQTVDCGDELELEDITFTINVNGVLNQTVVAPSMVDHTLNISN